MKLFPNFTSIPFDYLLISWVMNEFFNKIPVRILLDVLFRVFRFSKPSFCALTSSFMTF